MYVISAELISYWNRNKTGLFTKRAFIKSLGLDPGEYKFTASCAFMWKDKESTCTVVSWDEFPRLISKVSIITPKDYVNWVTDKIKDKENPIKEDKNVNRLQKQKTQIDRGDFPEGNRIKGRTCKASIGVGHLSYCSIKT